MSKKWSWTVVGVFTGMLVGALVFTGIVQAAPENVPLLAPVGTAFTYQGFITDTGNPANGSYNLRFSLWDDPAAGTQVGSTQTKTGVSVADGFFTVTLDFGSVFDGTALWLAIEVQGSGDPGYTPMTPRQALTPAPYASYAMNIPLAGSGGAATAAHSDHDHWSQTWSGSGTGLTLSGNDIGLMASGDNAGVWGQSNSTTGQGVYGWTGAGSGDTTGVWGQSDSTTGTGVFGWTSASSGYNTGVYGESASTNGTGVHGYAAALSGSTFGVYGQSASTNGTGVHGYATALSGTTYGVYGESASPNGTGVYGITTSTDTYGVYGYNYSLSGIAPGVFGRSDSTIGRGVEGWASATSGATAAVYGYSSSTSGYDFYAGGFGTNYAPFTGAHEVRLAASFPTEFQAGMIVSTTGEAQVRYAADGGVEISSTLPTVRLADKAEDKAVFGVVVSEVTLPEDHWYEAGEGERFASVNAVGEGRVWVSDVNGRIETGDYITTSALPGYGQRQDDDLLHSYTLGKATETIDWDTVTETVVLNRETYKVYLLAVVYTSG